MADRSVVGKLVMVRELMPSQLIRSGSRRDHHRAVEILSESASMP